MLVPRAPVATGSGSVVTEHAPPREQLRVFVPAEQE